ncbi:MAG: class I SAM-dependent methyltransferase [bacterium]|nr:class I SAM-dependent methyltransferase [bacterium]
MSEQPTIQLLPIEEWELKIKAFSPVKLLDVATGHGGFLFQLLDWFPNGKSFLGIDLLPKAIEHAKNTIATDERYRVEVVDAHAMDYPSESFDVVAISNSLHHMLVPSTVLNEMYRVLHRNGLLIVFEMFSNEQTETQMTHVLFHRWWAKVDSELGVPHFPTFTKQKIVDLISRLPYSACWISEFADLRIEAHDSGIVDRLRTSVPQYLERAKGLADFVEIQRESVELLKRLERVGVHPATQILIALKK